VIDERPFLEALREGVADLIAESLEIFLFLPDCLLFFLAQVFASLLLENRVDLLDALELVADRVRVLRVSDPVNRVLLLWLWVLSRRLSTSS